MESSPFVDPMNITAHFILIIEKIMARMDSNLLCISIGFGRNHLDASCPSSSPPRMYSCACENAHVCVHRHMYVCVFWLVSIRSFSTSWFFYPREEEVLKSHTKKVTFTQKESGSAPNLKTEPALQKLELCYYRQIRVCDLRGFYTYIKCL